MTVEHDVQVRQLLAKIEELEGVIKRDRMRHLTEISEAYGGYDEELDECFGPGYTNDQLRKRLHRFEGENERLQKLVFDLEGELADYRQAAKEIGLGPIAENE